MKGKRAVSKNSQLAIEAFVPWVEQQLNDLLIPPEDERQNLVVNVTEVMDLWIRYRLNCFLELPKTEVSAVNDAKLSSLLDPWIRYRLNDMLVFGKQDHKNIILSVKEGLVSMCISRIKPGLNNLLSALAQEKKMAKDEKAKLEHIPDSKLQKALLGEQQEDEGRKKPQLNDLSSAQVEGDQEEKMEKDMKARLEHILDPKIPWLLEALLGEQQKDEGRKTVEGVKAILEPVLKTAKAVLQNTEDERRKEGAVWEWVDKVMDVSYETVDVLQERIMPTKPNVIDNKVSPSSKLKEINRRITCLNDQALSSGYNDCQYSDTNPDKTFVSPVTTGSKIDDSFTLSRRLDYKTVLEQLLPGAGEKSGVKVISIVGCGGSGKTVLAKSLYNNDRAKQRFEQRAWVSVSNFFDEERLARDILDSIGKEKMKESESESKERLKLIEECFSGKVFLCVFDDVWIDFESSKWRSFASLLRNGAPGSRILVTTRSDSVANVVGSHWEHSLEPVDSHWKHSLKPVSDEEWWLLWKDCLNLNDMCKISRKMVSIGSKIAEKCHGWLLAAIAMGDILLNKSSAEEWQCELNNILEMGDEIWRLKGVAQELFRHFYWSYHKLSPTLKLCILHCADLDKGTVIAVDQLITMWMAQGYLGGRGVSDEMKRRNGLKNFNALASLSFFRDFERGLIHKDKITTCKLNDTFHDFIRYEARHDLTALDEDKYNAVQEKRARERHFHNASYGQVPHNLSDSRWKGIIALVLSSCQLKQVPNEVGSLSRLEYLDLSNNPMKELPEAVCELQSLQFLDVHQCYLLLSLPQKTKRLKQLKHLRVAYTTDELHKHLPPGFEQLTLLQTLDIFRTGGRYKDTINKLKGFKGLQDICIAVHGEVNISDADLDSKSDLLNLELSFAGEGRDPEKASKVVKGFKPPRSLQMLKLENYPLPRLPDWILEDPLLNNLTRLSIKSASNIRFLPALWKLSSLEFLRLYDIPNLKAIGRDFFSLPHTLQLQQMPGQKLAGGEVGIDYIHEDDEDDKIRVVFRNLKTLRIECMKNLDKWEDLSEDEKTVDDIRVMPYLEELIIHRCPKLLKLPLRILKDTPWFNKTDKLPSMPMTGEIHDKKECSSPPAPEEKETANVLSLTRHSGVETNGFPDQPTTRPSDKDACMKLKDAVQAYRGRNSKDYLEFPIPKGVLGDAEVTSCLYLKYLNDWVEPQGWVFAEQLCIWSKFVYEHMTLADKERVQMVSSALTTTLGRQEEQPDTRAEDLVNFMTINKARLYLVPYLRPGHWELLAIVPEIGVTYRFDSLHGMINTELTGFLKMVEGSYAYKNPDSNKLIHSWRIVDIKHKKQTGNWECGYYVMIWMRKIAIDVHSLDLEPHFPYDESPYEPNELKKLAQEWCAYVLPQFPGKRAGAV